MADITEDKQSEVVRITGDDESSQVKTTPKGEFLVRKDSSDRSTYGDDVSEHLEPVSQISATYGIINGIESFVDGVSGSVDCVDNMFECSTGTGVGGYGVVRTTRPIVYREGQGIMGRISAIFDGNAVASSVQFAGFFNLTDTIAFGYRGADFGILVDTYGAPEIRELTITASGNGTLTLTLNGTAYNIPITTGTIEHNGYEIEAWMKANQTAWNVQQVDDTVIFQARSTGAKAGTYSIAGAGTFAGTFAQIEAGLDKSPTTTLRASWSEGDPSWFDPTKSNVYMIKKDWGFGPIRFFIQNTTTGEFELVHQILPLGTATKPSVSKKAMKIGWTCASLGSTTDLTVKGASAGCFVEGESRVFGQGKAISNTNGSVDNTFEAIITIRTSEVFNNKVVLGRVVPLVISVANDATKPVEFTIVKNAALGETDFTSYASDSVVQYANEDFTLSNGEEIFRGVLSAGGSSTVNIKDFDVDLLLDDTITVYARKTSGTNPSVTAAITWKEDL